MVGLYVGSTSGYSGKNLISMALGMKMQKDGYRVGYMKPVGAQPRREETVGIGDDDAFFIQEILGLKADPALVTPVVVTRDFRVKAFTADCDDYVTSIVKAYNQLAADKDVMIVGGSGSYLHTGRYCGVDGVAVSHALGAKVLLIDRYRSELNYDYIIAARETLGVDLIGAVLNDIPENYMNEAQELVKPFLERHGVPVLGVIPRDPLLSAIKVSELAKRIGGKLVTVESQADRMVENFIIGSMQVENFLTYFKRKKNAAVLVGGDRSDIQLVALEGNCPCIILTGNLYPNDIIMTRSEVLGIPMIVVREDTYTVAKKMEQVLNNLKLRDSMKINHGLQLVSSVLDYAELKNKIGLK